jgi:hypothetical protein
VTVHELFEGGQFATGAGVGVAAAAIAVVGYAVTPRRLTPLPVGGILLAVGALVAIGRFRSVPTAVVIGVLGVAVTSALASRRPFATPWVVLCTLPFAWLLAFRGGLVELTWVRVAVIAAICVGGALSGSFDDTWAPTAPGLTLFVVSAAGVYLCAPDTEEIRALLGVAAVLALLGWPVRWMRLGRSGAAAAVATLVWVAAVDVRGRPASLIGALCCLGLLVAQPLGGALLPFARRALREIDREKQTPLLIVAHGVLVLFASRAVGLRVNASAELVGAMVVSIVAVGVGASFDAAAPRSTKVEPN